MKVELIKATDDPEELVCTAARNDYRSSGVADQSFGEVMEAVEPSETHGGDRPRATGKAPSIIEAKKRTLLDKLIDSGHWGPFEHPQATVSIEGVTRVLMAQITRHRHFTFDVMSLRYVELDHLEYHEAPHRREDIEKRFQFPEFEGEDFDVDREGIHEIANMEAVELQYSYAYLEAVDRYQSLLNLGVPQEQARKVLPMGTKVNIVVSANARAWMHVLNVRTKANVQGETRRCAEAIFEELKEWMPYTFEKYDEDVLPLKLNP